MTISPLHDMLNELKGLNNRISIKIKVAYTWAFVFGVHVPASGGNKKADS